MHYFCIIDTHLEFEQLKIRIHNPITIKFTTMYILQTISALNAVTRH